MIQITPQMRIFVAKDPVDFRKGIDGLSAVCRNLLREDPFSGSAFVFRSRSGIMVRILVYDGQGFWLMTKRLSKGRFPPWRRFDEAAAHRLVQAHSLQLLLAGGAWESLPDAKLWRSVAA